VGLIILAMIVAMFYGYWYLTNEARIRRLAEKALRDFSNGASVSIQSARYGMFSPVKLEGVTIRGDLQGETGKGPPIRARSILLWHNPWKLLSTGQLYPTEILCSGAELRLVWQDSQVVNFSFFKVPGTPGPEEGMEKRDIPRPTIRFRDATVYSYSNISGIKQSQAYDKLTVTATPQDDGSYQVQFEDADRVERGSLVVDPAKGIVRQLNLEGIGPPRFLLPPKVVKLLQDLQYSGSEDSFEVQEDPIKPHLYQIRLTKASLRLPVEHGGIQVNDVTGIIYLDTRKKVLYLGKAGKESMGPDGQGLAEKKDDSAFITGVLPQAGDVRFKLWGQYGKPVNQGLGEDSEAGTYNDPHCFCDVKLVLADLEIPQLTHMQGPIRDAVEQIHQRFNPRGRMNVSIDAQRPQGAELEVRGQARLSDVQATYRHFPYPVKDLSGTIRFNARGVESFDLLSQGDTSAGQDNISIAGGVDDQGVLNVRIAARSIPLDDRLKQAMGRQLSYVWKKLSPRGRLGFQARVTQEPGKDWKLELDLILAGRTGMTFAGFPYPLEGLTGTIHVEPDSVFFDAIQSFQGDKWLATLSGKLENLSSDENYRTRIALQVQDLPLDQTFLEALPAKARRVVEALHAQGRIDRASVTVHDASGQDLQFRIVADLQGVCLAYEDFPLPIENVRGQLTITPDKVLLGPAEGENLADGEEEPLKGLVGTYRDAVVTLGGKVDYQQDTKLDLRLQAKNLEFDRTLYLSCPAEVREVWDQFNPKGKADIHLDLAHRLSEEEVNGYTLSIEPDGMDIQYVNFPLPLRGVEGRIVVSPVQVTLEELTARHEGQFVKLDGTIDLEETTRHGVLAVEARDIIVNEELLAAVPDEIAPLAAKFKPGGKAGLDLKSLKFDFTPAREKPEAVEAPGQESGSDESRKAAPALLNWQAEGAFSVAKVQMDLGLEPKNITGTVSGKFTSDEKGMTIRGRLDLENIEVGPRKITDLEGKVYKDAQSAVIIFDELAGKVHGGKLAGFAEIRLAKNVEYGLSLEFDRIDVDSLFNAGQEDPRKRASVSGKLGGRVSIVARAGQENLKAEGKIQIKKAKLYKLPVMLGFLHVVYLTLPTDSAFTEASAQYEISRGKLVFNEILLNGNALSLIGSGNMVLKNKRLRLTFVAGPPGKLPTVGKVADEIAKFIAEGLFVVKVSGTVENPVLRSVPLQGLQKIVESILAPSQEDNS
jgi:hypothetical protein